MDNLKLFFLKQIDLFEGLNPDQLKHLGSCFHHKPYKKGQEIRSFTDSDSVFLVKKGVVEVYALDSDGKKVILDILEHGHFFTTMYASDNTKDSFDFYAVTRKDAMVCQMKKETFFQVASSYPEVAERLLQTFYKNMAAQKERIFSLAAETVEQRLIRLLKSLCEFRLSHPDVLFTHEDLAHMIGTSRQTVTTIINQLEKDGKVVKDGRFYQVVDQKCPDSLGK